MGTVFQEAKKNKELYTKSVNISQHGLWIICGLALGYCLKQSNHQRMMDFTKGDRQAKRVQTNAIGSLKNDGYIDINKHGIHVLTVKGFEEAYRKLKSCGVMPKDLLKEAEFFA